MKLKHTIAFCSLALGLTAMNAQEIKLNVPGQPNQAAPAAPAAAFTDAQIVEELGWFYGKKMGLDELGFTKSELDALVKGMLAAAGGKDTPYDMEKIGPMVDQYMQKKQDAYMTKLKEKALAENMAFFTKLKENKNVQELPSGLRYEIVQQGTGPFPKAEDNVKVHYKGTLVDGSVFDSSIERNEPVTFALKEVIPGWTEGIQKVNKGGKIKLYVPPHLAYGDSPRPGIPPSSTLIFEVELLEINPPAAPAPAEAAQPQPQKK